MIAASNHQYLFDPALWRRFDDVIEFPAPEAAQRLAFLQYLLNGVRIEGGIAEVSRRMAALSYSDIQHITIEAVKTMLLQGKDTLQTADLLSELQIWKRSVQKAKKRNGAKAW